VPVTLLQAEERGSLAFDYGWVETLGHPIDVVFVPGDHYSMMREPAVRTLAATIDDVLGVGDPT
jgi:thioesterase domain-containing protein